MIIIEPKSPEEFRKYYNLRYEILRKPWGQPFGSEKDDGDETSIHRMLIDKATKIVMAIGRLQFNSNKEAQIRYMAVATDYQGKGFGSCIIKTLEEIALEKGVEWIVLHSRVNALQFYKNNGYKIVEKSHILFGEIQHWFMKKGLEH